MRIPSLPVALTHVARLSVAIAALCACTPTPPSESPEVGSQTNWLLACETSEACGDLECLCGTCTVSCDSDAMCRDFPGAQCVPPRDDDALAICEGRAPLAAMCLPRCDPACEDGTACVAGVCEPTGPSPVRVLVDTETRHQTLVGFGASLAYAEAAIVAYPGREALYDLVFGESGLDVFRVVTRYDPDNPNRPLPAAEIIAAAAERLGRAPLVLMTSATPPPSLKANGARACAGELATCTLTSQPDTGFDYAGFARYWREALDAYAQVGLSPDYISIQNNPNWIPPANSPNDACRFLPVEGTTTVTIDGAPAEVAYPGYREALAAVRSAISDMSTPPRITAPENGPSFVGDYVDAMDAATFDAVAIHLYGVDAVAPDVSAFTSVRDLATRVGRPVFQTEMQAEGLETAVLVHHAMTGAGASAYLQNNLVAVRANEATIALSYLDGESFEAQEPYYALSHFARHTDPGWVRIEATSDGDTLLASAWLAPNEQALTVVLVNPGSDAIVTELSLPSALATRMPLSRLTRTTFGTEERAAELGALPTDAIVQLPARSIMTVALTAQ